MLQSTFGGKFVVFAATAARKLLVFHATPAVPGCDFVISNGSPLVVAPANEAAMLGDISKALFVSVSLAPLKVCWFPMCNAQMIFESHPTVSTRLLLCQDQSITLMISDVARMSAPLCTSTRATSSCPNGLLIAIHFRNSRRRTISCR